MITFLSIFFLLLIGHAIADFPLQTDSISKGKNRHRKVDPSSIPPGQKAAIVWPYFMSAHALIHAGAVALVTGSLWLALAEFIVHWIVDYAKCENWTTVHQDQMFHVLTKAVWAFLA